MIDENELAQLREVHAALPFAHPMEQVAVGYLVRHNGDIKVGSRVVLVPVLYKEGVLGPWL